VSITVKNTCYNVTKENYVSFIEKVIKDDIITNNVLLDKLYKYYILNNKNFVKVNGTCKINYKNLYNGMKLLKWDKKYFRYIRYFFNAFGLQGDTLENNVSVLYNKNYKKTDTEEIYTVLTTRGVDYNIF